VTPTAHRVLSHLASLPGKSATAREIQATLGISSSTYLSVALNELYGDGYVTRAKAPPTGVRGRPAYTYRVADGSGALPPPPPPPKTGNRDRYLAAYRDGATLQDIADGEGITRERVRQLITGDEYHRIKAERRAAKRTEVAARQAADLAARLHPCGTCGTPTTRPTYCSERCYTVALLLRFGTDEARHERHRVALAKSAIRSGTPSSTWFKRFLSTDPAERPAPRGRWFVEGSSGAAAAMEAYRKGWPIFDRLHPDLQAWIRERAA
jgi:DNA-binding CsgD family transcriptional regulator